MAANSKREQILLRVVAEMEGLKPTIKKVDRKLPAGIEDLERYASTQLPLAVVVGRMPRKKDQQGGQRGTSATCVLIRSILDIEVYGYFMDNINPDSTLSSLADDFYRILGADPSKGGLVLDTEVIPDQAIGNWEPYVAFKFICRVTYTHTPGGL